MAFRWATTTTIFEFMDLEGQIPYDLLLKETDADLVKMELDLYWVRKAKKDAVAYFDPGAGFRFEGHGKHCGTILCRSWQRRH